MTTNDACKPALALRLTESCGDTENLCISSPESPAIQNPHSTHFSFNSTSMTDLPDDIMGEIFLYTTLTWDDLRGEGEGIEEKDPPDTLTPSNIPWTLTHVSRHWRAVALSLSRLWSIIFIDFIENPLESPQTRAGRLRLCLQRARRSDLFIGILSLDDYSHSLVLETLLQSIHQCSHLSLLIPVDMCDFLASASHMLVELQALHISYPGVEAPGDVASSPKLEMFHGLPKLVHIACDAGYCLVSGGPWPEVKSFDTNGSHSVASLNTLAHFTGLTTLAIRFSETSFPVLDDSNAIITLPSVRELTLRQFEGAPENTFAQILKCLVFPNVLDLFLCFDSPAFLSPEHIPPQSLVFDTLMLSGQAIAESFARGTDSDGVCQFLFKCPNIRTLSIYDMDLSLAFIRELTLGEDDGDCPAVEEFLPHLIDLTGSVSDCDHEAVYQMVLSRYKKSRPLRRLALNSPLSLSDTSKLGWEMLQQSLEFIFSIQLNS